MSTLSEHNRHHHYHPHHHHPHLHLPISLTGHQISWIKSTFDHVLFCAFILWNLAHIFPTFIFVSGAFLHLFYRVTDKDY